MLAAVHHRIEIAYLDLEVGVQQELEVEALLSLIADGDDCLQRVFAQCDAVHQTKIQRPCLAVLLADAVAVKTEVELYGACVQRILGSGLAQVFPARVSCEAVLRELRSWTGGGRWTEDLASAVSKCLSCPDLVLHMGAEHTGKTTGTPPLMGFFPVRSAASLTQRFSVCPPLLFQLVTVAPKRYTSTLSPEGNEATTFWLPPSPTMSTCAEGPELLGALKAEGRLARSTIVGYVGAV